jgi:hypothetical protein
LAVEEHDGVTRSKPQNSGGVVRLVGVEDNGNV